jgi:hypothetical protein
LTLPTGVFRQIDKLRGSSPRSVYLSRLLQEEERRHERKRFFAEVNAAYTPEVSRQTLRLNEEFPIHDV